MQVMRDYAFQGCYNIEKVEYSSIENLCSIDFGYLANPLHYAHHLFINGQEITDVIIPPTVKCIRWRSFEDCYGIKSVQIPNTTTTVQACAFHNCTGLTEIVLPYSITDIGWGAFAGCNNVKSLSITSSATTIEDLLIDAFGGIGSSTSPCKLIVDSEFNMNQLGTKHVITNANKDYYIWHGGYFSDPIINDELTNITKITSNDSANCKIDIYNPNDQRLNDLKKGINIIRYQNGRTMKVIH